MNQPRLLAIQDEIVIEASGEPELLVVIGDPVPITVGVRKSKGLPATGSSFPVGIRVSVHRRRQVRVDPEHVPEDIGSGAAGEIEAGMLGEVHRRSPGR